jgi:hypothetical protein
MKRRRRYWRKERIRIGRGRRRRWWWRKRMRMMRTGVGIEERGGG